jgi:hypothetical protein
MELGMVDTMLLTRIRQLSRHQPSFVVSFSLCITVLPKNDSTDGSLVGATKAVSQVSIGRKGTSGTSFFEETRLFHQVHIG